MNKDDNCDTDEKIKNLKLTPNTHRLVLNFLNEAVRVEDLVYGKPQTIHVHGTEHPEHHKEKKQKIIEDEVAKDIIELRDKKYPLGFRHIVELFEAKRFTDKILDGLIFPFSNSVLGEWNDFPLDIPRLGPGSYDGIVHATLLLKTPETPKVLFITADETTLLWDPKNTTASTFEDPVNQPHTMTDGYSLLCGHHVLLSDNKGSLLVVGGGGYGPRDPAKAGYIFDPVEKSWSRTNNDMAERKWYPTAVSLGGKKVLIVSGKWRRNDVSLTAATEIFDEDTKTFQTMESDEDRFPNIYPGLHLLPNNAIFYSGTGWASGGTGTTATTYGEDESPEMLDGKRPAYFSFDSEHLGTWQRIASRCANRTKGMSCLLLSNTAPYARIFVMGGIDNANNNTYEIFDASTLSPTAAFDDPIDFPDGEHRILPSGVLLPDGNLFVCGGIQRINSPCAMFDTKSNSWSAMANLPSIRDYHSAALLLPSGQVMMAGWYNSKIEIFSPPYCFRGARPTISSAPDLVHHGADFTIESPDAASIVKVTLVRPMAVTHQTDSEQKVIELPFLHDHVNPDRLKLTAPNGEHPHPIAQRGHYMLFVINEDGVPSEAKAFYLH